MISLPQPSLQQQPDHRVIRSVFECVLQRLVVDAALALQLLQQQVLIAGRQTRGSLQPMFMGFFE